MFSDIMGLYLSYHYSDVTRGSYRLISSTSRLFVQQFVGLTAKKTSKARHHWPLLGFDRWISHTKRQQYHKRVYVMMSSCLSGTAVNLLEHAVQ